MPNRKRFIAALSIALCLGLVWPVAADPGDATSTFAGTEKFKRWSQLYEQRGGDRKVLVTVRSSTRGLSTENVAAQGFIELDLIAGRASILLSDLDRAVDVFALDNKPGPGRSILAEDGDVLIHLGRLAPPAEGGIAELKTKLGSKAFRGFELDWILVSEAGRHPGTSRLLYGVRSHVETVYTRQRLAREGHAVDVGLPRPLRTSTAGATAEKNGTLATSPDPALVTLGLVSQDVFDGADVFFRETFEGNGRSCGTCHPAENNQVIEKEFIATLPNSDPLFVPEQREAIDPNDPISDLERMPLLREFGLILENVDGLEDPNVKFTMRGVPHSLSMATSIALDITDDGSLFAERTGWSGDGAPASGSVNDPPSGRLIDFLLGAIIQHYPNNSLDRVFKEDAAPGAPFDFRMPTQEELRVANEYMLEVGRKNDMDLTTVSLTNANAENGRVRFQQEGCNFCHFNANANALTGGNRNFPTNVEFLPNLAQGFMGINFPLDGGFGGQGLPAPNEDCDGDLTNDCFGNLAFNTPPLVEAADTAPFFHNNTAQTIEESVQFYTAAPFAPPIPLTVPGEVNDVAAFLRVLNASFNLAQAIQRTEAALALTPPGGGFPNTDPDIMSTANKILALSIAEINDAIDVLTSGPLGDLDPTATGLAANARLQSNRAIALGKINKRKDKLQKALDALHQAQASLGSGMVFDLGTGNLVF